MPRNVNIVNLVGLAALTGILAVACSSPTPVPSEPAPQPAPAEPSPTTPEATLADKYSIYLIAGGDRGRNGKAAGCNDSVIPVEWEIDPTDQPLREALDFLLSIKEERVGPPGLYNALAGSNLQLDSLEIDTSGHTSVKLSGEAVLGGYCDLLRFQAQLEETVLNSPGVTSAEILINETPLEELTAGE